MAGLVTLISFTSPMVFADRQQAAIYYEEAVVLNTDGKLKEAIILLKNALQQDAGLLPARVLLGTIYMKNNDNQAAEKELHEAERQGADRGLTAVPLARTYLKQHKYQQLITELTLDNYPPRIHGDLLSLRGLAHLELLDFDKAQKSFSKAAELIPDSPAPYDGMALLELRQGDTNASIRYIEKALKIDAGNVETLNIKATIIHAQGDLQTAVKIYDSILELAPSDLNARLARAGVYMDLKQFANAERDLKYLEEYYPFEPRAVYLQSLLYYYADDQKMSKEALLKTAAIIKALNPEFLSHSSQHLLLAGLTYYALGNFEQASLYLKKLLQLTPNALAPKKLLASAMLELQNYSSVIDLLQPVVDAHPGNDYKLLTLLGNAYMLNGEHKKAIIFFEQAVAINADYTGSRTSLALSYYNTGNLNQAADELASAFINDKQGSNAGAVLATIHLKQNKPAKALGVLKTLVASEPDNLTYLHLLGSAQAMLKDFDSARASFLRLETFAPESVSTQIHLSRLDTLTGNPDKASKRLQAALIMKNAYTPNIMLELAKNEDVANNVKGAIRWAEKARAEDFKFMEAKSYLIDVYRRTGEYAKALEVALESQRVAGHDSLNTMQTIIELYIALNDYRKAGVWLKNMATLSGFEAQWLYRIAQLQYRINQYREAEYSLQKAVQDQPDFIEAQVALIEILTGLNKLNEAETRIHSLEGNFSFKDADRLLGDIAVRRGNTQKAIQHYHQAMLETPSSLLTIRLFQAYITDGNWKKAISTVKQWLKEHPEDINAREALAEAYLQQNQPSKAQVEYEAILKTQPDSPRLLSNLAYVYSQTGNNNALSSAKKAYELAPRDAAVNDTLGWILVNQKNVKDGLIYLREAHSRESNNPEIRYHIAVALFELGRIDEAKSELQQALSTAQPFNGVEQARVLQKQLEAGVR